jgi:hypothetical protein
MTKMLDAGLLTTSVPLSASSSESAGLALSLHQCRQDFEHNTSLWHHLGTRIMATVRLGPASSNELEVSEQAVFM